MIDPAGTVVLEAVVSVPTVRFADVIALVADASVMPTTFGTVTGGGVDAVDDQLLDLLHLLHAEPALETVAVVGQRQAGRVRRRIAAVRVRIARRRDTCVVPCV